MTSTNSKHDRETHLINRSASLSLVAVLFFFVGLVSYGVTAQKTEDMAVRAASGAPLGIAIGSAMWARVTRARLRALRDEVAAAEATATGAVVQRPDGSSTPDEPSVANTASRGPA